MKIIRIFPRILESVKSISRIGNILFCVRMNNEDLYRSICPARS